MYQLIIHLIRQMPHLQISLRLAPPYLRLRIRELGDRPSCQKASERHTSKIIRSQLVYLRRSVTLVLKSFQVSTFDFVFIPSPPLLARP